MHGDGVRRGRGLCQPSQEHGTLPPRYGEVRTNIAEYSNFASLMEFILI